MNLKSTRIYIILAGALLGGCLFAIHGCGSPPPPLKHPAVEQNAMLSYLQLVARAGDLPSCPVTN